MSSQRGGNNSFLPNHITNPPISSKLKEHEEIHVNQKEMYST